MLTLSLRGIRSHLGRFRVDRTRYCDVGWLS
jgi:hypothetical protein